MSLLIVTILKKIWKESVNSDGQQLNKYQCNKQPPLISSHWTQKSWKSGLLYLNFSWQLDISSISAQTKPHFRWSYRKWRHRQRPCRKWRNRKSRDRKYVLRMRNRFPRFFLTIVEVQSAPLRMTHMATGCGVIKRHLTPKRFSLEGCAHVTPKGFSWKGGVRACATGSRDFSLLESLLTGNDVIKRHVTP